MLIIDIESGEYVLDSEQRPAVMRANAAHPEGALYGMRIGFPTMSKIGGGWGKYVDDKLHRHAK